MLMITITNFSSTLVPFTLNEKTTYPLSANTYILEIESKQLNNETLLFLTGDTSTNISRYNYFPIDLTPYSLPEGQYNYKVYQNTGNTLSISGLTTDDVVETGLATITGSGSTPTPVFTLTGQTEYVFN